MPEPELMWRMHFMFGTMSYAMAGNDALQLLASRNLEGADDANAIMRRVVSFPAAELQAPLPTSQTRLDAPGRRAA